MTERELIQEAQRRGYHSGTLIDYQGRLPGTNRLGSGEFELKQGDLIKYCHDDKSSPFRKYDTIWSERDGWVKIATKPHGIQL